MKPMRLLTAVAALSFAMPAAAQTAAGASSPDGSISVTLTTDGDGRTVGNFETLRF